MALFWPKLADKGWKLGEDMNDKDGAPKLVDRAKLDSFGGAVPFGEYRLYSGSSQLPFGIPWGGSDCKYVMVAASAYSGGSISGLSSGMTPKGAVYLWRAYRIGPSGSPPYKVDDCLYYTGPEETAWSLHSKDAPDHHKTIMSGSDMNGIAQAYGLPSASAGRIGAFRESGAHLDFEQPFWGSKRN